MEVMHKAHRQKIDHIRVLGFLYILFRKVNFRKVVTILEKVYQLLYWKCSFICLICISSNSGAHCTFIVEICMDFYSKKYK